MENKIQEIAKFFVNLYSDELEDITSDSIYEWWSINWSNWVEETNQDVYNEVEKAILGKIRFCYSEDGLIKFDKYSEKWPSEPEKCAYLVENNEKLELDEDSSDDSSISYYQGKNGALMIEHDSDGTENPINSGWYPTSSFEEYKEMYL